MDKIDSAHPLNLLFQELVHEQYARHIDSKGDPQVEAYLTRLLVAFVRTEDVFAIRDAEGRPLRTVFEMLAEADVRLNATSFARERAVHKHIGDFLLFWSGVYPAFLHSVKIDSPTDLPCDYTHQGQSSYHLVSTFDHPPYQAEAPTFRALSQGFPDLAFLLRQVTRESGIHYA